MITTFLIGLVSLVAIAPKEVVTGESFIYSVEIEKPGINRIARFEQNWPANLTIEPVSTQGASFEFKDGVLKMIWIFIPPEDKIIISYKITVPKGYLIDLNSGAKFSYLNGDEKEHVSMPSTKISVKKKGEVENVVKLRFSIQVIATNKRIESMDYFYETFQLDSVKETFHEGMYKYVYGNFNTYLDAKQEKENLIKKNGNQGFFIVAYHNNLRILITDVWRE
jgi:hypothetical protein